jgi:hypothetical protein
MEEIVKEKPSRSPDQIVSSIWRPLRIGTRFRHSITSDVLG